VWYGVAAYGMRLCLIAMVFGPYVRDAQTARLSMFSHYFKRVARLPKLATSSLLQTRVRTLNGELGGIFKRWLVNALKYEQILPSNTSTCPQV